MAFEVLKNLPVLKNSHNLGNFLWIFTFLANFPHYTSSSSSFILMKWPPEGLKLSYSIYQNGDLSGSLGTHPDSTPRWIWPQRSSFFARIILRCRKLKNSVALYIQCSKFLFLHFWPKLSCLFTFFKNFCAWHNLQILSNILCIIFPFSTFLSFAL